MGAYVYYDGFNFYYRLFKNKDRHHQLPRRFKWLDLLQLSIQMMPDQPIDWIGYFTAEVDSNSAKHARQQAYLDALSTIPCLEVIKGEFLPRTKNGIPVGCSTCGNFARTHIEFATFEEKGSDVNLAARLVRDAALGSFTEATVVSNDSDLKEAIRIATQDFGRVVHVRSPDHYVIGALARVATSANTVNVRLFKKCEFPATLSNNLGVAIQRPVSWWP